MRVAILGTRGIPNFHGGFEQFAEYFSVHMAQKGHQVYVYNSHDHPYQESKYKGVNILHIYDPESKLGTFGQFIYDLNCIRNSRNQNFDVILQLGYTSSSIWGWLLPKNPVVITNMDGLEWKRSKYSKPVRKFLKIAEKLAVRTSNYLISDSIGIESYIRNKYEINSKYIAYGATLFADPNEQTIKDYNLELYGYDMLVARLEPENNIEVILEGVSKAPINRPLIVIGKHETKYGEYLKSKFSNDKKIQFLGGIYNQEHLNNLRYFSNLYFHGHSVGGTNPSLLEAMASKAFIIANDNIFNRSILEGDAFYFSDSTDIEKLLDKKKKDYEHFTFNNFKKIEEVYSWDYINRSYETFLKSCVGLHDGKRQDEKNSF